MDPCASPRASRTVPSFDYMILGRMLLSSCDRLHFYKNALDRDAPTEPASRHSGRFAPTMGEFVFSI